MSTIEIELNNMNTTSDGSPVVTGDEHEQKGITGLDELLQQELKEDDSVDCFIKRVGDTSEDSSEFGLNYDEAPVVSNSAFYNPKEETRTDKNSSSLEKEFEITLDKSKEAPITSDANKLQSGEEETKEDMPNANTSEEDTDECTKEIEENGEDNMLDKHGIDPVQNQGDESSKTTQETDSQVKDQINKERIVVGDTVRVSVKVKIPSEETIIDTRNLDKDTEIVEPKYENSSEAHKDVLYLVFQPKDQVSQKNDSEKDNENKETVQCSEKSTISDSISTSNTSPDKPTNKTVFTIAGNNEAKNVKEINKSIIVKKITAKIIKNINTATTKPANESEINDHAGGEESQSTTKSSELEEKQHDKLDVTTEESETAIEDDDAATEKISKPNIIITKKVYGNSKKSPKVLQEKQVSTTDNGEAPNVDKQDDSNTDEDKDLVSGDSVKLLRKTRVFVTNEGKTLPVKLEIIGNKSDGCTKKTTTSFGAVKRKFEEICRLSREEEDAAMEEIKKMKQESLDVLKKINAEMEKLKLVFLAGK